jgi:hypothetical protein
MTSFEDVQTGSPFPPPVPVRSLAVGALPARGVVPTSSAGDLLAVQDSTRPALHTVDPGTLYLPPAAQQGQTARTAPSAFAAGPPPLSRPARGGGMSVGATAQPAAPIHSDASHSNSDLPGQPKPQGGTPR